MSDLKKADGTQILTGQVNYNQWSRNFQVKAIGKGVWKIFTGEQPVVKKPDRAKALADPNNMRAVRQLATPGETSTVHFDKAGAIAEYRLDLDEYREYEKQVSTAIELLADWVDPSIKGNLLEHTDPKDAWEWLQSQYKMNDKRALDIAINKMEGLKLSSFASMSEYLNEHQRYKLDIQQANGNYSDASLESKIIRGLPERYDTFVDQFYYSQENGGANEIGLKDLTSRLLSFEAKIADRNAQKHPRKNEAKPQDEQVKAERKKIKSSKKCGHEPCGKWGHTTEECYILHPELKKKKSLDSNTDNSNNKNRQNNNDNPRPKFAGIAIKTNNSQNLHKTPGRTITHPATYTTANTSPQETEVLDGGYGCAEDGGGKLGAGEEGICIANKARKIVPERTLALMASSTEDIHRNDFVADCGANTHVMNDHKFFTSISPYQESLATADGIGAIAILGEGTASIVLINEDGVEVELELKEVSYAPGSRCNLISLSKLFQNGNLSGRWGNEITVESAEGFQVGRATLRDGLYFLDVLPNQSVAQGGVSKIAALIDFSDPVWDWHRRLGHIGLDAIRKLLKQGEGISLTDAQLTAKAKAICPICATTRAIVRIPRDPANRRFERLGELIHVDTWGRYPIEGYDGSKYFIFFTDDAKRYTWCESFAEKDTIPAKFRKIHRRIEKTCDATIRRYRFDNEFDQTGISDWLNKHGVTMEVGAPYAHHQMGVAERNNRTVRDRAAAMVQEPVISGQVKSIIVERSKEMLRESTLPENLWPEAFRHATWIKNRAPTRALKKSKKTPWEALTGNKPCFTRERIWGSRAYVTIPPETRVGNPKLHEARGWLGYYVGCESESVYRIWNPDKHKVIRVSMARIENGEGLDDPHSGSNLRDRLPNLPQVNLEDSDHDGPESNIDQPPLNPDDPQDHSENEVGPSPERPENISDDDGIIDNQADSDEPMLSTKQNNESDHQLGPETLRDDNEEHASAVPQDSDSGSEADDESDEIPDNIVIKSKFFGGMTHKRKRPAVDEDVEGWETDTDTASADSSDSDAPATPKQRRIKGTKCRYCLRMNRICVFTIEPNGRCDVCCKRGGPGTVCNPDITGFRSRRKKSVAKFVRVKQDDKCKRCRTMRIMCDGKTPCNACIRDLLRPDTCTPWANVKNIIDKKESKCIDCKAHHRRCNYGRPCQVCLKRGICCTYQDQGGLVRRRYNHVHKKKFIGIEKWTEDEIICNNCRINGYQCDGGTPCRKCFMVRDTASGHASCTYLRTGAYTETYTLAPYHLSAEGNVILDSDHESQDRSRWYYRGENAIIRGRPKRVASDEEVSAGVDEDEGLPTSSRRNPLDGAEAFDFQQIFDTALPRWALINTSSTGFLCAVHAARNSWIAQHPNIPPPSVEELMQVFRSSEFTEWQADFQLSNYNNLHVDQIAAVLHFWADTYRDLNVQLGFIAEGRAPLLLRFDDEGTQRIDVWIHNDNAEERGQGRMNHFSGIRPVEEDEGHQSRDESRSPSSSEESDTSDIDPDIRDRTRRNRTALVARRSRQKELNLSESSTESTASDTDADLGGQPREPSGSSTSRRQEQEKGYENDNSTEESEESEVDADIGGAPQIRRRAMTAYQIAQTQLDEPTYSQTLQGPEKGNWVAARDVEYRNLILNNTWTATSLPKGRKPLTCRWVHKRKLGPDGQVKKYKARLCARGFQQIHGIDFNETYASCVKPSSYKALFALQAIFGWKCHQMDVVTAFLNSELEEEIYMRAPQGYPEGKGVVLKLNKAIYGLKQSSRVWYGKLASKLQENSWRTSAYDPCVFIHNSLSVILAVHIDDILLFGKHDKAILGCKASLGEMFRMTDEGEASFYLGIHIHQYEGGVALHQQAYTQQIISRFGFNDLPPVYTPSDASRKLRKEESVTASDSFRTRYQEMVGSLMYLATATRPDISHATGMAARYNANPNQRHLDAVTRIYAYLNSTPCMGLVYRAQNYPEITGYVDSDWAGCEDTSRSTTGWFFTLGGSPISWSSQRQKTVTLSSCEAEYIATTEAIKEALWTKRFINDLQLPELSVKAIPLFIDNESALKLTKNPEFHARTKHIKLRHHWIREIVAAGEVSTHWIRTQDNLADIFTKAMHRPTFEGLRERLGLADTEEDDHLGEVTVTTTRHLPTGVSLRGGVGQSLPILPK